MSYVKCMSYVSYMSYVNYMNLLHLMLMNPLKSIEIAWNNSKNYLNYFKHNIFVFKNFKKFFKLIYNDWKYWDKILKHYVKEPIFKDRE